MDPERAATDRVRLDDDGVVGLPAAAIEHYRRFTAYNSPYVAHDRGRAVDLYPATESVSPATESADPQWTAAPSPVAGEVIATETVRAPPKPYAPAEDHLVVVDCGPVVARIMHVEPTVSVGETIGRGDDLGSLVRAGFFARWVPRHLHVDFRTHDQDHLRASGALPLDVGVDPIPVEFDGSGTVVDVGDAYAVLDAPADVPKAPPGEFYGLAATVRAEPGAASGERVVLDGGLEHYDAGGVYGDATGPVELLGERVGTAHEGDGGTNPVAWRPLTVRANDDPVHGLSLFCGQAGDYAIKLVGEELGLDVGESVTVTLDVDG